MDWVAGKPGSEKEVPIGAKMTGGPNALGFDYFYGFTHARNIGTIIEQDHVVAHVAPVENQPLMAKKVVEWIDQRKASEPFFLYFPLTAPHYPIVPTAEFKGRSRAGDYGDYVAQVDATVGEVMAALERTGFAKNTLVVFTSDNGPEVASEVGIGAYERIKEYGHRSMDGLRGVKRDAWEGGHRVPFIARWPDRIPANKTSDEIICHVDLLATCAAMLGEKLPAHAGEDSYDIMPALLGKKLAQPIREATVLHSSKGALAIRQGDWVLIDAPSGDGNHEPEWFKQERGYPTNTLAGELYNLRDDLMQRKNLYGEKPEIVKHLKPLLDKYKSEGRSVGKVSN